MDVLDGNALAGSLAEHFETDVTESRGECRSCGAWAQIAELRVYASGPGTIARCPSCGAVVIALIRLRDRVQLHGDSFRLAQSPGFGRSRPEP